MRHPLRRKAVRTIGSAGILAVIATQQPVLAVSGEAEAPACNGVSATIIGTAASEVIHGTDGSDVIVAGAGDDSIVPGGGNDIVCAEEGNDVIRGIEPEGIRRYDSFSGGLGDDLIRIGPGGGRVAGDDFPVYSSGEVLPYPGGGNDLLIGSGRSDRFHPGPGDDIIRGGRQRAGVGRDIVEYRGVEQGIVVDLRRRSAIGDGRDTLRNIEQVIGSDFADQLTGSNRSDHLIGWGDDDRIVGAGGDDHLVGNDGDDQIYGRGGDDFIRGNDDDDYLHAGPGTEQFLGGYGGHDTCISGDTHIGCEVRL